MTNILSIASVIFFFFIIPSLNKKNPGQTLGKKIFSISVLFFGKNNFLKGLFLREIPIGILFTLSIIFKTIGGYEESQIMSIYANIHPKEHSTTFIVFLIQK